MFRRYLSACLLAIFFGVNGALYGADSELTLDSSTSTSGFAVKKADGSTIARFGGDGNVGIGTTAPIGKLDIVHDNSIGDVGLLLRGNSAPSTRYTSIWSGSVSSVIDAKGVAAGGGLLFYVDGAEKFRVLDSGKVGIGTTAPIGKLDIVHDNSIGDVGLLLRGNSAPSTRYTSIWSGSVSSVIDAKGVAAGGGLLFYVDGAEKFRVLDSGKVGIGTTSPQHPLHMGSGAHVTAAGVWTNASSREYKENIRDLTADEAMQTLDGLRPTRFNYKVDKDDEYVGFIAEDVPDLVATRDRKGLSPMDLTAVLTKVVQAQQRMLEAQNETISALKAEIDEIKGKI